MSISKRVEEARKAYEQGDKKASARAHSSDAIARAAQAEERHGGAGSQYIGEMVYGGLDGIITTFAVVSGVAGAQLGTPVILILGLANLLADGFSMATGAYLSSKSEQEYYQKEYQREAWEVEHFPDGERAELYEIYRQRGFNEEDSEKLVDIYSREPERWVKAMMVESFFTAMRGVPSKKWSGQWESSCANCFRLGPNRSEGVISAAVLGICSG